MTFRLLVTTKCRPCIYERKYRGSGGMAKEKARRSDENGNENEFLQVDSGLGLCNTREGRRRGSRDVPP